LVHFRENRLLPPGYRADVALPANYDTLVASCGVSEASRRRIWVGARFARVFGQSALTPGGDAKKTTRLLAITRNVTTSLTP
jgi:hypothetical protein